MYFKQVEYIWSRPEKEVYVSLVGRRRKLVASLLHSDFIKIKSGVATEALRQFLLAIGEGPINETITFMEKRMELATKILRIGG